MNDNKKRYVLFSKDDGRSDAEKPCAFFASPAGCKNGSNCKFLHGVKQNINFHQSLNTSNSNVNNNLSSSYNINDRSNDNASIAIDNSNNTNVKIKSKDKKIKNTDNQYDLKATTVHSSSSFPTFSNNNNNYNNNHAFKLNSSQLHGSSQLQPCHTTVAAVSSNSNDLIIQQLRDQLAQQQQLLNTHVLTNTNANNQAFNYSQAVGTTYDNNQVTTHTPGSSADTNYIITQQSSSSSSNTKKKQEKKRKSSDGNEINDNSSPLNTSNKKKSSNDTSSSIPVSTNNHMDLPYHSNPYSSIIASTQVIAGNSMSTLTQHHHQQQQPQPPSLASITNYETNDDYDEDEDEDNNQFLLSVVNHVLDSSAQKAPLLSTQFQQQQYQPNQQHQHHQSLQLQQNQQIQEQPQQQYVMSHLPPPISNQHQIIAPTVIEMKQQQPLIQTKNTYTTVPTTTTTAVSSSSIIATNPFINSQDALKALQSSGSTHALYNVSKKNIFATPKTSSSNTSSTNNTMINNGSINNDVKIPKNIFNPALVNFHELPWMKLVEQTKLNFRYPNNYTYVEDSSWVKAKIYGPWCINNNNIKNIISLDCEMCETTDPVTNNKYDNTLIRISVFDIDHKVLIDSLVQPGLPITETRTNIHGITEKQLAVAPWTLRQAQAALLNICSDQTIIIGHSIHKDLKSLKFNHKNVIDTAYLYTVDNEPGAAPSLRDISEQILGIKLPETHNSIQDAQAALYAAATLLAYGPQPSISRKSSSLSLTKECSLLIHRIPDYCNEEQLHHMIIDYTYIVPIKVNTIIRSDSGSDNVKNNSDYQKKGDIPSGKTIITFSTQQHRDLAFESIVGPNRPDKQNRPQKRIYFKGGGYICIRR